MSLPADAGGIWFVQLAGLHRERCHYVAIQADGASAETTLCGRGDWQYVGANAGFAAVCGRCRDALMWGLRGQIAGGAGAP